LALSKEAGRNAMSKEPIERIADSLEAISRGIVISDPLMDKLEGIRKELESIRKLLEKVHHISIRDYGIIKS
jgi:hypothetical protein